MKTLVFTSQNKDINVEYEVDLIGTNDQFSIIDAKQNVNGTVQWGLNGEALTFGMPDKNTQIDKTVSNNRRKATCTHTPHTLTAFTQFAATKNLTLQVFEEGQSVVTKNTLTEMAWVTETLDAGVSGVAQLEVVTFPATAAAAQGDYVVLTNALTGEKAALWLDIDADGTAPTGVKFTGADYKIKVSIVTGGAAAANGTLAYTALAASDWATGITLTDNEDGTVDVQQDYSGVTTEADPENTDSTGAGSITATTSVPGTAPTAYEMELKVEGGSSPYVFTTASTLPVGITLNPVGVLEGSPRETGTFALTITATDYFGIELELTAANLVITATA